MQRESKPFLLIREVTDAHGNWGADFRAEQGARVTERLAIVKFYRGADGQYFARTSLDVGPGPHPDAVLIGYDEGYSTLGALAERVGSVIARYERAQAELESEPAQ